MPPRLRSLLIAVYRLAGALTHRFLVLAVGAAGLVLWLSYGTAGACGAPRIEIVRQQQGAPIGPAVENVIRLMSSDWCATELFRAWRGLPFTWQESRTQPHDKQASSALCASRRTLPKPAIDGVGDLIPG